MNGVGVTANFVIRVRRFSRVSRLASLSVSQLPRARSHSNCFHNHDILRVYAYPKFFRVRHYHGVFRVCNNYRSFRVAVRIFSQVNQYSL